MLKNLLKKLFNLFDSGELPVLDDDEKNSLHQKQSPIMRFVRKYDDDHHVAAFMTATVVAVAHVARWSYGRRCSWNKQRPCRPSPIWPPAFIGQPASMSPVTHMAAGVHRITSAHVSAVAHMAAGIHSIVLNLYSERVSLSSRMVESMAMVDSS